MHGIAVFFAFASLSLEEGGCAPIGCGMWRLLRSKITLANGVADPIACPMSAICMGVNLR